jgi:predicted transcriptional regulator of viral defense system
MSKALQASETLADSLCKHQREILALLVRHGGYRRQKEIVSEMAVSKGQISQYISSLNEGGHLQKVTLGRENVLYLPGCEPEIVQTTITGPEMDDRHHRPGVPSRDRSGGDDGV